MELSDYDIERIADAIVKKMQPQIPFEIELWDSKMIAAYLKKSVSSVRQRITPLPSFPKAIRLPSATKRRGAQPLYKAAEVVRWAEKYKDKN